MKEFKLPNKVLYNKHKNRKNNDLVAAMYAMYKTGKSLESIGKVYKISRQAVYDLFRSRGYELRSKKMLGLTIIDGIKFTVMAGGYLRGTIPGRRITIQKYVWEKMNGPVPTGFVIHYIDGNKLNNSILNLELVPKSEMSKVFNPNGNNQYTKK